MTPTIDTVNMICNDAPDDVRRNLLQEAFSLLLRMDESQLKETFKRMSQEV